MPFRAPRLCGCGRTVPAGDACPCQLRRARERKAAFDRTRPSARERGYDTKWDVERAAYLKANPRCVRPACDEPATVVDHIIPHRGNMGLFWNRSNWRPLCRSCHNRHKQSEERKAQ